MSELDKNLEEEPLISEPNISGIEMTLAPIKKSGGQFLPAEEVQVRRNYLLNLDFNQKELTKAEKYFPSLFDPEKVEQIISFLTDYRFIDSVSGEEHKFKDPLALLKKDPAIIGYTCENIDNKINGLKERGFSNPIKMVEAAPQTLGYSFENIDDKISGLIDRGFSSPEKIIKSIPQIFGYSWENIDRRLELFKRLAHLYQLRTDVTESMEKIPNLWSMKFDKLIILARILRDYEIPKEEIEQIMSRISFIILEDLLVALKSKKEGESISALIKRAKEIRKQKLSKDEKREMIANDLESVRLERQKIAKRYFKGYPDKKDKVPEEETK
jgi:hypothetical protein